MVTISDPLSIPLLLFEGVYIAAGVALLVLSGRARSDWVKGTLGAFGLSILGLRLLAVIPSWWLYYADAELKWGGNGCTALDSQCLKQTIKDTVVVIQNAVVLAAFVVGFVLWQRKHPKQLAPGEPKPEATGGYK